MCWYDIAHGVERGPQLENLLGREISMWTDNYLPYCELVVERLGRVILVGDCFFFVSFAQASAGHTPGACQGPHGYMTATAILNLQRCERQVQSRPSYLTPRRAVSFSVLPDRALAA